MMNFKFLILNKYKRDFGLDIRTRASQNRTEPDITYYIFYFHKFDNLCVQTILDVNSWFYSKIGIEVHVYLKLTWKVIYHWKRQPYFFNEPISKTGY